MLWLVFGESDIHAEPASDLAQNVAEQSVQEATIAKVEADLKKFGAGPAVNPGQLSDDDEKNLAKNYDLLKAYLMLTDEFKGKAEPSHLVNTLGDYWSADSNIPADLKLTARAQLEFWAKQVDRDGADGDFKFPRVPPDAKIVARFGKSCGHFPAWQRYYRGRVSAISNRSTIAYGLTTVSAMLARDGATLSLLEGTYTIPAPYATRL
jgi:type VI protein secretion system component VasK